MIPIDPVSGRAGDEGKDIPLSKLRPWGFVDDARYPSAAAKLPEGRVLVVDDSLGLVWSVEAVKAVPHMEGVFVC